jgi:hypothetical protein
MGCAASGLQALPEAGDHHRRPRRAGRGDPPDHERAVERGRQGDGTNSAGRDWMTNPSTTSSLVALLGNESEATAGHSRYVRPTSGHRQRGWSRRLALSRWRAGRPCCGLDADGIDAPPCPVLTLIAHCLLSAQSRLPVAALRGLWVSRKTSRIPQSNGATLLRCRSWSIQWVIAIKN